MTNLFDDLPNNIIPEELFATLLDHKNVKIERIISTGQITPENDIYDQLQAEWVLLLQGNARIWLEEQGEVILSPGDYLFIKPQVKHKVTYTSTDPVTIWLAIHIFPEKGLNE